MPDETASGHWLRSIRLSGFTFVMLGLIVFAVIVLAPSLRTIVEQQQQIADLRASVEANEQQVTDLEGDIARWEDPAYIEAQARERIYYVYPGEFSYLVVGDIDESSDSPTIDGEPISDEIQTTQVNWVQSLLSSVVTAGVTDAAPSEFEGPK